MIVLVHVSDLHFGKPHRPEVTQALLKDLDERTYDALVVSGDLTQRAKVEEFREVRAFLDAVPDRPTVVTVGNHDVPLYRVFERLWTPHRNYRRYVQEELDTVTRMPGATLVALDSSAPRSAIVNGVLRARQLDFAERAFEQAPDSDVRILVTHHALAPAPDNERDHLLPGAAALTARFQRMGVELFLCGHLHRSFVAAAADVGPEVPPEPALWIVHSGTTTSRRGRARERTRCSFNVVELHEEHFRVTLHIYDESTGVFGPHRITELPRARARSGAGASRLPESVAAPEGGPV